MWYQLPTVHHYIHCPIHWMTGLRGNVFILLNIVIQRFPKYSKDRGGGEGGRQSTTTSKDLMPHSRNQVSGKF